MAEPVIVIGAVNAAAHPFFDGSALIACTWATTCCLTVESQLSTVTFDGAANAALRSAIGSSIDGSVWKNSTPPEKLFSVRPVSGSSKMPVGRLALRNTVRGPRSESASRIVNPAMPASLKPPSIPTKNTRCATAVVVFESSIRLPAASILRMPPISAASSWPPNMLPCTWTPIEVMPTIGNSPCRSFPTSIWIPWIEPENSRPSIPLIPVTLAESVSVKFVGSVWMCGQVMPIASILIGSQLGHMKLSPPAEPTLRKTPKLSAVWNEPSP